MAYRSADATLFDAMRRVRAFPVLAACALASCESSPPSLVIDGSVITDGRVDATDAEQPRGDAGPTLPDADRVVVLPYMADEIVITYEVESRPSQLDLHVSMDTTTSFEQEIDAVQASLTGEILPAVRAAIDDTSVGVSSFEDFPAEPFGGPSDRPFTLHTAITSATSRVSAALADLDDPLGFGGDFPESGFEALYQIATGDGYRHLGETIIPPARGSALPGGGTEGGVGFRPGSLRAVLHVTDARSHTPADYAAAYPGTRGREDAIEALTAERIRVIGIASGAIARDDLTAIALGTGAIMAPTDGACPTGIGGSTYPPIGGACPLVFDVLSDGTGLTGTIIEAITSLVESIRFAEVTIAPADDRLGFITRATAASASSPSGVPLPVTADVSPADGNAERFLDVFSGTTLRFELALANRLLPELDYAQIFLLDVAIVADGAVILAERIRVVVPARPLPDAGGEAGIE